MNEPDPSYNVTYSDVILEHEKPAITDELMRHYFELKRERTIAALRSLDRLLGREQTIPKRVR